MAASRIISGLAVAAALLLLLLLVFVSGMAAALQLDIVYRYSPAFHEAAAAAGRRPANYNYKGVEYNNRKSHEHVKRLIHRDRQRHSFRGLLDSHTDTISMAAAAPSSDSVNSTVTTSGNDTISINSTVTPAVDSPYSVSLSPSNETASLDALGGLHYTFLSIGTPNSTFLVALDTGSDLLWVPCDCIQCSSTDWTSYGLQNMDFAIYSPSKSNTSKTISCSDSVCSSFASSSSCSSSSDTCDYVINYMSANTSTSGKIVQDLLHLKYETSTSGGLTTPIYFGCGEVQTGDLVEGVAPDGLFGLGPNTISVPNTIASNGLVSNSFSMCFSSSDNSGRLIFGTQAKEGVKNTPLVPSSTYYVVKVAKWAINGDQSYETSQQVIFDTGTSYTTLPQSTVQAIGKLFQNVISFSQYKATTFDYCWSISGNDDLSSFPSLTLIFSGGSTWEINNPYVYYSYNSKGEVNVVCLGILSGSTGIIGYNFMPGYEFIFNQQSMTLSWASTDCYNMNASEVGIRAPSTTYKISTTSSSSKIQIISLEYLVVIFIHSILLMSFVIYM